MIVNNGILDSDPDDVVVGYHWPLADAGADQRVIVNTPVSLSGKIISPGTNGFNGYKWTLIFKPDSHDLEVPDIYTSEPGFSFTASAVGRYVFGLEIKDNSQQVSPMDFVTILVVNASSNPNDIDSDDDGLSDGLENNTYNTNPGNSDSDSDGLQDGTELGIWQGTTDTDLDIFVPDADKGGTTTDPRNNDCDVDKLDDGEEDANQDGKIEGDYGHYPWTWGVWEDGEVWTETDPNDDDTDGDDLLDGENIDELQGELGPHYVGDIKIFQDVVIYESLGKTFSATDPLKNDTDGDGLLDSIELQGWSCNIYWASSGEHIEEFDVYSDPTISDSDGDGLLDSEEFVKGSNPFDQDTDDDNYFDEKDDNVTGVENILPHYIDYSYKARPGLYGWNVNIKFTAQDLGGIKSISVKVYTKISKAHSMPIIQQPYQITRDFDETLTIQYDGEMSVGEGINIFINITDANRNSFVKEDHIKSIAQVAKDVLKSIADKIKEVIGGWVKKAIKKMLNPIMNGIDKIANNINDISASSLLSNSLKIFKYSIGLFIVGIFATIFIQLGFIENKDYSKPITDHIEDSKKSNNNNDKKIMITREIQGGKESQSDNKQYKYVWSNPLVITSIVGLLDLALFIMAKGKAALKALAIGILLVLILYWIIEIIIFVV